MQRTQLTTQIRIGFVGLGHMGGSMASRYLDAGYPVHGTSRDREHVQDLIDAGLRWWDTPGDVAEAADVVFTSLPDETVLQEVAAGSDGIIAGLGAGKTWVDVSTISPHASRDLAMRVRGSGAVMLDAPVSGSVPQVHAGTLTIMVGGDETAYARVEHVLRELGNPTHVGENGQGQLLKLAVNISLAGQMLALAEGLLLAEHGGMDPELVLDVMTNSPIGSPMLKARAPLVLDLPQDAFFDIGLMRKDIELARDTARQLHVPLPTADRADEILTVAGELGYDRRDIAGLFQVLERMTEQGARVA
jgi:3-hydroxyisobutyrate dehydrogenase-like beta-hydroxyacid dehydrogenase